MTIKARLLNAAVIALKGSHFLQIILKKPTNWNYSPTLVYRIGTLVCTLISPSISTLTNPSKSAIKTPSYTLIEADWHAQQELDAW